MGVGVKVGASVGVSDGVGMAVGAVPHAANIDIRRNIKKMVLLK